MRDLITGAPGPDLECRIDDLEHTVRTLESDLLRISERLKRLEEANGPGVDLVECGVDSAGG